VEWSTNLLIEKLDDNDKKVEEAFETWFTDENVTNRQQLQNVLYDCLRMPVYESVIAIRDTAVKKGLQFREFYTTSLIGAHKEINGKHCVFGYWRGDGAIAYHVPGRYLKLLGTPDGGDYAGQTRFLDLKETPTQDDILDRIVFDVYNEFGSLMLMTDGISDP